MAKARHIREPARDVPVFDQYDVVVVGGGIAGVAASVAAAREGARTALMECGFGLGGLATLGNIIVYLPLCDGNGRKVSGGLAEELLKLADKEGDPLLAPGGHGIPDCWKRGGDKDRRAEERYVVRYNAESYRLALEALVLRAGVDLLYGMRFGNVIKKRSRIEAILAESKSGRVALRCDAVVDASGDGDVCALAGEPMISCDLNVAAGWFYSAGTGGVALHKATEPFDVQALTLLPGAKRGFRGDDAREVSEKMQADHQLVRDRLRQSRKSDGDESLYPIHLPSIPGFRLTRRLGGPCSLVEADDGVFHPQAIGMIGHWRKRGPYYFVPYASIAAVHTGNLFAAGRCAACGQSAWDLMRVIPSCAVTGQAAGVAAARVAASGTSAQTLDMAWLQERLRKLRVPIDRKGRSPHRADWA